MSSNDKRTSCIQCGTCCRKGGPALHREDSALLQNSVIRPENLITIRKGEQAFSPLTGKVEPTPCELVKINGRQGEWTCCFFDDATAACTIYSNRPYECRLLECWRTEKILSVVYKDTLTRHDIIHRRDKVMELIMIHEHQCPSTRIEELLSELSGDIDTKDIIAELTELVRHDLAIRTHAIRHAVLPEALELFILGRPLFKQLAGLGIDTIEKKGNVYLQWHHGQY